MASRRAHGTAWRRALALGVLVLASFGGCDADPQPSPGIINRIRLILSTSHVVRPGGPLDLIGIIGLKTAAPGVGIVIVRTKFNGTAETVATADGTFAALLPGAAGDELTISFKIGESGRESEAQTVTVPSVPEAVGGVNASPATPTADNVDTTGASISAKTPRPAGTSEVTGTHLTAGHSAEIGNTRTGEVVEATVATDGTFSAIIGASANDSLVVIIRDPTTGLTSGSATLSVPSS